MYMSDYCTVPMPLAGHPGDLDPRGPRGAGRRRASSCRSGFQIAGPAFSETGILDAAHALERAIGLTHGNGPGDEGAPELSEECRREVSAGK